MDLQLGAILAALLLMVVVVRTPEVNSPFLRKTACFCGKNLTFFIFAFHIPLYGVMKEWRETVPAFAWALDRSWLLPFLIAAASTLLAVMFYGLSRGLQKNRRSERP